MAIAATLMAPLDSPRGFSGTAWAGDSGLAILLHDFLRLSLCRVALGTPCYRFHPLAQIFSLLYLAVTERLTLDATIAVVALSAAAGSLAFVSDLLPAGCHGSLRETLRECRVLVVGCSHPRWFNGQRAICLW